MDFKVAGTRRHHRAADGHQDHRRHAGDHERRARAGEAGPRLDPRQDARGDPRAAHRALANHAPRISTVQINPEYIGMVIGKGGETIRSLEADYEVQIDIEEDGTILIYATDGRRRPTPRSRRSGADEGAGGRRRLHRQGRQDDRLRRVRRAEEGHRRPAPRLERRPGPRRPHRGRDHARRRGRRPRPGGRQGPRPDRAEAGRRSTRTATSSPRRS